MIPVFKVVESDEMSSNLTFSEHFDKVKVHMHQLYPQKYPQGIWRYFQGIPVSLRYPQVDLPRYSPS